MLANYYLNTEGVLPPWLAPPPGLTKTSSGARPTYSTTSSGSGSSMYRAGNKSVSLQDIYDSAGPNQPPPNRTSRQEYVDQRQSASNDRLRGKLRPTSNTRPTSGGEQDYHSSSSRGHYSGRSGFGGGKDPYEDAYQALSSEGSSNTRQGQGQGQYGSGNAGQYGRPARR